MFVVFMLGYSVKLSDLVTKYEFMHVKSGVYFDHSVLKKEERNIFYNRNDACTNFTWRCVFDSAMSDS
jgi:hypothetical protein